MKMKMMRRSQVFSIHFIWPGLTASQCYGLVQFAFVCCLYFNMVINLSGKIKTNELMLLCPYNEIYIHIENRYAQAHRCS